jgi:hypothetical protein
LLRRPAVHARIFSPFTHFLELYGYERALIALLEQPTRCHALPDLFTRVVAASVHIYRTTMTYGPLTN